MDARLTLPARPLLIVLALPVSLALAAFFLLSAPPTSASSLDPTNAALPSAEQILLGQCWASPWDIDGDCIPDRRDRDVDGDGISNRRDRDIDGDGIANRRDRDIDGDGIANRRDRDMDGDGISNRRDRDRDGDGIPNYRDRTPNGSNRRR